MTAVGTLMEMIIERVGTYNNCCYSVAEPERRKHKNITLGLLLALKNIKEDDKVYALAFTDDFDMHMQFGYYDDHAEWHVIA